ncbi:MAG: hypothetical protein GKR87_07450 [Kiritimatiellae bacterium]|nr:hypothetical protein [Kiritimatiellia bacterium]
MKVQVDTRHNKPAILADEQIEWKPTFYPTDAEGSVGKEIVFSHRTSVHIEMEAAYVRGKLSVDEFLKQCAIVNPHLQLHYRVQIIKKKNPEESVEKSSVPWRTFQRVSKKLPDPTVEIKPHPHGIELGLLMQMLKDTQARTLRAALNQDFSRVSSRAALEICETAKLNPQARPTRVAHQEK